jgi:hypothetical protein
MTFRHRLAYAAVTTRGPVYGQFCKIAKTVALPPGQLATSHH